MSNATRKITLSTSRDIPFNKLVLSQSNVRRVKAGASIEDLAEDIARRGLLQSLNVRPLFDAEGRETGTFEVPAGGRRYQALALLVKQKRLSKTAPVPCIVQAGADAIPAEEDSLAENVQRAPLHPLDQFRAFQALREKGRTEEEIAAAFFVSAAVVRQRLRLAAVSPVLLDVYAEDGMSLDQLMAFTISSDHARQEQVWDAVQRSWSKEPYQIRRLLTEKAVRASDRRARFVGIEAYEQAGGIVLRDLFQGDDGGWLQDVALLERLVAEKLKAEADAVAAEGWKWIEAAAEFPYGHTRGLRRLQGEAAALTEEERQAKEAALAEYDRLTAEYDGVEELPDEADQRFAELEEVLEAFDHRPPVFPPDGIARAGVFISIGSDGSLIVDRGYVRPGDEEPLEPETPTAEGGEPAPEDIRQPPAITVAGIPADPDEEEEDVLKPLPDRLVVELTAHRTLALQDAVANSPHAALTALLHKLVIDSFGYGGHTACLEASVREVYLPVQSTDLKDSSTARAIDERHEAWKAELPIDDDQALWDRLDTLDDASRLALLAHCLSRGVNALYAKADRYGGSVTAQGIARRLAQADRLARAVGLDMAEAGWVPTVDNYLGRVSKRRILDAVREAKGEQSAQLIDHLKKADMAREAERLLSGTGWLPEPLRLSGPEGEATPEDGSDAELPAFLSDGDGSGDEDIDEQRPAAAE